MTKKIDDIKVKPLNCQLVHVNWFIWSTVNPSHVVPSFLKRSFSSKLEGIGNFPAMFEHQENAALLVIGTLLRTSKSSFIFFRACFVETVDIAVTAALISVVRGGETDGVHSVELADW